MAYHKSFVAYPIDFQILHLKLYKHLNIKNDYIHTQNVARFLAISSGDLTTETWKKTYLALESVRCLPRWPGTVI